MKQRHTRRDPRARDRVTPWLFLFLLAIYLLTVRGYYGGDHFYSYMTAESLVLRRSFALSDQLSDVPDIAERQAAYLAQRPASPNGRKYSFYGYGMALAMAVFYWVGHIISRVAPFLPHDYITMASVSCLNAVLTALTGALFFRFSRCYHKRGVSLALVGFYAFGTMAWNNAQYGYAEPLNLLFLLLAIYMVKLWQNEPRGRLWRSAAIGGSLGAALLTEVYSAAVVTLCVALYMLWRVIRNRGAHQGWLSLVTAALAGIPFVAFLLATNMMRYGHLMNAKRLYGELRLTWIPFALYGWTLSSGKSLFLYCPVLIPAIWGCKSFIARHKTDALLYGAILIGSILPIATWINWWNGDLAWGPRFLFHLVPLLLLPVGEVIERLWRDHRRRVWLVSAAGLWVNLASILVNQGRYVAAMNAHGLIERLWVPYLSPVIGHWLLIISRIKTLLTGISLTVIYPSGPWSGLKGGAVVDLGPYDSFDLWFINIPVQMPSTLIKLVCTIGVLALVILALWSGYRIRRLLTMPEQERVQA